MDMAANHAQCMSGRHTLTVVTDSMRSFVFYLLTFNSCNSSVLYAACQIPSAKASSHEHLQAFFDALCLSRTRFPVDKAVTQSKRS